MVAMKNLILSSLFMLDFQILDIPFKACQDRALRIARSFSVLFIQDPRYLKSSTHSISVPLAVCNGLGSSMLKDRPCTCASLIMRRLLIESIM